MSVRNKKVEIDGTSYFDPSTGDAHPSDLESLESLVEQHIGVLSAIVGVNGVGITEVEGVAVLTFEVDDQKRIPLDRGLLPNALQKARTSYTVAGKDVQEKGRLFDWSYTANTFVDLKDGTRGLLGCLHENGVNQRDMFDATGAGLPRRLSIAASVKDDYLDATMFQCAAGFSEAANVLFTKTQWRKKSVQKGTPLAISSGNQTKNVTFDQIQKYKKAKLTNGNEMVLINHVRVLGEIPAGWSGAGVTLDNKTVGLVRLGNDTHTWITPAWAIAPKAEFNIRNY
jgi:hypothetical protein